MTSLFTYLNPFNLYYGYGPTDDFKYFNGKYHLTGIDHQQIKHLIPINKIRCIYDDDIDTHQIKIITENNEGFIFDGTSNINRLLYDIQRYYQPSTLYLITNIFDQYSRKFVKKSISNSDSTNSNNTDNTDNTINTSNMILMMEKFQETDTNESSDEDNIVKENPNILWNESYVIETNMISNQYSLFGFVLNEPEKFVYDKDEAIHIIYNNDNRYFTIDTSDPKYKEISKFFSK